MTANLLLASIAVFFALTFVAWRRYLWAAEKTQNEKTDTSPFALTEVFGDQHLANVPHQKGIQWLTDVFDRSAAKFPNLPALQIPHTQESLTFAELDARSERIACAIAPFLDGPDQVVAVAMTQDNWQIVASHLAILRAGGTLMFIDATLPEALIDHMLNDAQPVLVLTRGQHQFRDLPTLDVLNLPESSANRKTPDWLDDPAERLATIFYTSGTTGMPRGVECHHAGYVNLALSYAEYFDLIPGMDATSLTSSLGYDGSISEMYSAWVSGCSVVLLTKDEVRSGPDLIPVLIEAEVTVLFCPPVLLTTLTQSPENDLPYPICRYIVPAGEAFPAALVEPWTRNRRQIINTYGPTEASTDTSRQSLRPGEPITIGSPFPNVTYVILEVDGDRPLPHGEAGELCIGGVHVSRGYRNLPEQTEKKFIIHPDFGRLYRTGDRAQIDVSTLRVHFLGRIDSQLKVRGHRVEAQAVEDILQTQFKEIEAAVVDYQNEALVAFVSAPSINNGSSFEVAPAPDEWAERVTSALIKQLPAPSVPSKIYLVQRFVLKPVSGKIDRKCLPDLSNILADSDSVTNGSQPESENGLQALAVEADDSELQGILAMCRTVFETPLGLDDEFALSGGHSIAIARLAQKLFAAGRPTSVRSLLSDCNTVRKVAERSRAIAPETIPQAKARSEENGPVRDEEAAKVLSVRYFTALQILFSLFQYSPAIAALILVVGEADIGISFISASVWEYVLAGLALYLLVLLLPFAALVWAMLIKSFMGGDIYKNNVKPGVYPKWSRMHLRIWCILRVESMVLVPLNALYRSAPLRAFAIRQLGATVGKNLQCAQDSLIYGPIDLITIEDDVAIQTGAYIQPIRWSGQYFSVGPIHLESGCKIGMRAAISNNVTIGNGTWITPFTPVLSDVGSNEIWEGAPARLTGRCIELRRTAKACEYTQPVWLLESFNVLMQIVIAFTLNAIPVAIILWFVGTYFLPAEMVAFGPDLSTGPFLELVWHLVLFTFITTWAAIVISSVLGCLFIRFTAASPGLYPSRGLKATLLLYRTHKMNAIQRQWTWTITGQYLRALAGMRFSRVGGSECDVMYNLVPELAVADSQVFWSNGCFTNMLDYGAEHIKLRRLVMPRNFFTGNNSVAEHGQFPSNFLLGVSTPVSEINFRGQMKSRESSPVTVAGNPPIRFANLPGAGNEAGGTPSFPLFFTRVFLNDVISIGMIPITAELLFTILFIFFQRSAEYPIAGALIALVLAEFAVLLLCVAVKRLIVGADWGADHSTPFWSWRHFAYFFAQDCFFVWCREPLRFLAGTTAANSILRWMGCKVGDRTIIAEPMQCFDWNAVNFGSDCFVDGYLQLHTFENMTLTVKKTSLEDGCAVNTGATIMGGAVIGENSTLLPLSLMLKETNAATAIYEGSPADPADDQAALEMKQPESGSETSPIIDSTDWLKTAAILMVLVDHTGFFLMDNEAWWSVFGRLAAPVFFFLMGFAHSSRVPAQWIFLGVILTALESSNNDWEWVTPNILLSFALVRLALPYVRSWVERYNWAAYGLTTAALIALLPLAGTVVDYGSEGWLWALFGLSQRMFVDNKAQGVDPGRISKAALIRVFICVVTAVIYIWQEQKEFSFSETQLTVAAICVGTLALGLCAFSRGKSRLQPPRPIAWIVGVIGRQTLAIYALELVFFELLIKFVPSLAH